MWAEHWGGELVGEGKKLPLGEHPAPNSNNISHVASPATSYAVQGAPPPAVLPFRPPAPPASEGGGVWGGGF